MFRRTQSLTPSLLAMWLAASLSPGCTSTGGSQAAPRQLNVPPTPPPLPPPPAARSLELPPAPPARPAPTPPPPYNAAASDFVRLVAAGARESVDRVSTAGSLTKQGDGLLVLEGPLRFDGGTSVQSGTLALDFGDLFSNVSVSQGATFEMNGNVIGNVVNNGILDPTEPPSWYDSFYDSRIFGDYTQGSTGVLRLWFGLQLTQPATPLLTISGRATLDGTVQFVPSGFVPAGGYLEWLLHAQGGVSGQFGGWSTTGSLFLAGDLRYTPNDVYFLATRVSTKATMAASTVGDPLILDVAARVDAAFGVGDSLAALPDAALTATQRQFLQSAASIQRLSDYTRAAATFDSLAGQGHVAAAQSLLQGALDEGPQAALHAASLRQGTLAGSWSAPASLLTVAGGTAITQANGYDYWLSDRLVMGSRLAWTRADLRFERAGGSAQDESPTWSAFLRGMGDNGAYALVDLGLSRHQLSLDRAIDLGGGGRATGSKHSLEATHAYLEAGRELAVTGGQLTPFAALDYATLRGAGFTEKGTTGFELNAQPAFLRRLSGDAGLRYVSRWHWAGARWAELSLDARYRHLLYAQGQMRAAFTGTPEAEFDLTGLPRARDGVWLGANLTGGGERWSWLFRYDRRADDDALSMRFQRDFR